MLFRLNKQANNREKRRREKQTYKNPTKPEQTAATTRTINICIYCFSDKSAF